MRNLIYILFFTIISFVSCNTDDEDNTYTPTPATLTIPQTLANLLPVPPMPADNPLTEEGIALGKKLFYDRRLSENNTVSCGSCHKPSAAFSDNAVLSTGTQGQVGERNAMPLFNLAWNINGKFNWDGSANSIENQILIPVTHPLEMNNTWPNVEATLQNDANYPTLFEQAFGQRNIDSTMITKAIAQFLRTLVSGNSKFDKHLLGEATLTAQELNGLNVFMDEKQGDCFHCHGNPNNPLWTNNNFHNNGLDAVFEDRGLGLITGDPAQFGWFKSPSLRNLAYTAPYMHDGRFATLDEVIDHYSEGLVFSETIDPLMKSVDQGGVQLNENQKADLKAFLLSLSDPSLLNNPAYLPSE